MSGAVAGAAAQMVFMMEEERRKAALASNQTWLICGGRDFWDYETFSSAMSDLLRLRGCPSKIVNGGAPGADALARRWAREKAIDCITIEAEWKRYGSPAGRIRNQKMLDQEHPQFIVAFPGGRGTADMVARARKAEIEVAAIVAPAGREKV